MVKVFLGWIWVFISIPIAIYSAYTAYLANEELSYFKNAVDLSQVSEKNHGKFYKVSGEGKGSLKAHPHFPETQGTLQYLIEKQTLNSEGQWVKDTKFQAHRGRVAEIALKGVTVLVKKHSKLFFQPVESYRLIDESSRYRMKVIKLENPVTVYGHYDHGYLTDGTYQRLFVAPSNKREELYEYIAKASATKTKVLCGISLFFFFLAGANLFRRVKFS